MADMRRRFLVAALFSVPIILWSAIGSEVLGFSAAAPFGLRDDVFQFLLSLPVISTRHGSSSMAPSGPLRHAHST